MSETIRAALGYTNPLGYLTEREKTFRLGYLACSALPSAIFVPFKAAT
jgi:hypothetical protein